MSSEGRTWMVRDFAYPDEGVWIVTDFDPNVEHGTSETWTVMDFDYPDEGPWVVTDFDYNVVYHCGNPAAGLPEYW